MSIDFFIKDKYHIYDEPLYLGSDMASSWCFGICIYGKYNLLSLADWIPIFSRDDKIIVDQFGCMYLPDTMLNRITIRGFKEAISLDYVSNGLEIGPNNLVRRSIGKHGCISHGKGTWDYIMSDKYV